ncbi:MAG: glutamate racemase [Oculatellaceae cyanobacterium bins.114]|nr:glutamate racemase [Oculatellaceae cyanobacterium bins.114]
MQFPVPNFSNHSPELTRLTSNPQDYSVLSTTGLSLDNPQRARIAVFDSGVGGLTVLREVYRQLPHESVLYVADTAHLPYGTRSQAEIVEFTREILAWLQQQNVKMVLMACNTSSALALETVQTEFDVPMLGVILPGARAAVHQGKRIGVIATPATAASHAYRRAIAEIDSTAQVWQVGCPEFVPLIEQNRLHDPYTLAMAQKYLNPLIEQQIDTLIYGCTHYPHLSPVIKPLLPNHVTLVDPAVHVVHAAAQELDVLGLRNTHAPLPTRFCVSGPIGQFISLSHQWLGFAPQVELIKALAETENRIYSISGDIT